LGFLGTSHLSLTPRRGDTLAALRRLVAERGAGVHYSEVAGAMGISAWTAYALLRELERAGLVKRSYAVPSGVRLGGRSRILFSPTVTSVPVAELAEALGRAVERFAAIADAATAARTYVAESLHEANGDLAFHLGFWMARLEAAGRSATEAMHGVLESGAVPAAKIQTLAGMGLGAELGRLGRTRLADRVVGAVTRLSGRVEETQRGSDAALGALVEAAREILASHGQASRRAVT
jgi:DNA-binding Lrp family transcriptional regulator